MPAAERGDPGGLVLDEVRREVRLDGALIALPQSGYLLLAALMRRPGAAMSSRELLKAMWGVEWHADTSLLQVHVSRLRGRLGESAAAPRYVVTVPGFGYRFEPDPDQSPASPRSPRVGEGESDPELVDGSVSVLTSLDRTIQWVSDNVSDLLGWRPEDLVGTYGPDLIHPETRIGVHEYRAIDAGSPLMGLRKMRTADGGWRMVSSIARPVVDASGTVTGILLTWRADLDLPPKDSVEPVRLGPAAPVAPSDLAVTLQFDHGLVLRAVTPRASFLGWQPEELIGTFYSPLGMDEAGARVLLATFIKVGQLEPSGPVSAVHRDGSVIAARIENRINVDHWGDFAGLRSTLYLPPP